MEVCEDTLDRELTLTVLLPGGTEETATVHGSKPVMDVLVTLCGEYHLNPSEHIMELVSPNQNHIKFKPNSLIGSLEAEQVVLRHRGEDERTKRKDPYMPEVSVRLMIFYRRVHRAVVRVSPKVPLSELLPAICDKCEYDPETTLLFLNSQSEEPLDLTKSLNDHGIREVFAKDMKVINLPEPVATPDSEASKENKLPPAKDKSEKGKENKSFFSFFRIAKKKPQKGVSASAPTSPLLHKQRTLSLSFLTSRCSTLPSEKSKKRRAPLPPLLASQSFPTNLNTSQPVLTADDPGKETTLSHSSSSESSLKRTKRRAPPPPALPPPPSPPPDDDATEDPAPKDVLGNLAPVTEVPEETLNEERSINYPVTALVHHTMNGTGGCLCEELHRNDKPREESSVCVECGSRKYECDRPTPGGQPEEPAESAASPSRRTPSAGSSLHNSPSWVGVGSSSGRLLRSSGSIGSGLTTFTVIPKLRDRERQHRAYQLEKQHSLDGPGYHSEQVEPSRRSSGHGEGEGNASESADKSKDWRTPATKPKPISGVPFWASQRSTAGHTSLMQELQKRVPVLNGEPHDQNRDRAEEKSRYGEREDQGGRNVEKKEEEKKEESADEEDWEEGKASHEEMMEQERDEVEEKEEEEEDKEEEEEDKEEEDVEEEGEEDEGFDGSEKESVEDDVEDDEGEKESVEDDDVVEDDGGDQEEEGEEKREEDEDEEEEEKEDSFPPPPPPVFWKEGAKAGQYSPTEAHHHPVDLSSTPGSCGSGRLPVAESPGGLSLFALAVAQRAQRFTQAFNTNRRRPGHPESPYSNGFVPTDLR